MKRQSKDQAVLSRLEESNFSPSEFMRYRHPDLFSDSEVNNSINLSRQVFEYHLETLTSRKQELEFEYFCRKLAEREICPNLIPQTGPIGGGDSQVDAETYPVSDRTALCWYEGIGREASSERWAFAFSAKKDWRTKVDSDIEKIVDTKRGYKLAFFVTNQFIKDKTRAEKENYLQNKYGIEVRIMDRSWIVMCVFEHDNLWLAIETLNISGFNKEDIKRIGPKDAQREAWLKELEEQITNPTRYPGVEYQKVEDCYEAALLARDLERSRVEVEGRFQRAIDIADRVNIKEQKLRIYYNYAWTQYWWYENYQIFNYLYDKVEDLAIGSNQADHIELLVNLWQILYTAVQKGLVTTDDAKLSWRNKLIKAELDRLIKDEQRPNNALQAQTNKLFIELIESLHQEKPNDKIFEKFIEVFRKSEGLSEYPITTTVKIIQELGDLFSNSSKYDELLNVVIDVTEKRTSEGQAGLVLLERGKQQFRSKKYYEAIKYFGRAQVKLAKDEYESDWIISIVLCGIAYEEVGLLWAARANLLMATSHEFTIFAKTGNLKTTTMRYLQKLVWLEIRLGFFPSALSWIELSSLVIDMLALDDDHRKKYQTERENEDQILAVLLIKTEFSELNLLDFLPVILRKLGFYSSWMTLLYILGYEDFLRMENVIPEEESSDSIRDLFSKLYNQPVCKELPYQPEYLSKPLVKFTSPILGCKLTITVPNDTSTLYLAENIIGALESFLATSFDSDLLPYRSELDIYLEISDFAQNFPEYKINKRRQGEILINCPKKIRKTNSQERSGYRDWLQKLIVEIACQIVVIPDVDSFIDQVIKDELSFDRAILFSDVEFSISNILGENIKIRLSDWKKDENGELFPLKRENPWNFGIEGEKIEVGKKPIKLSEGEMPENLLSMDRMSHKDRKVISMINIPIWDQAKWSGMGYMSTGREAPCLTLCFKNPEPASKIFSEWYEKLGSIDEKDKLRVVIITGIKKKSPYNYKVLISTNLSDDDFNDTKMVIQPSRFLEMYPDSPMNLNIFLSEYKRAGKFVLVPAVINFEKKQPDRIGSLTIEKNNLVVRPAWEIGANDPDVMAIQPEDDPIIPEDVKNAPVLLALRRFDKQRSGKRHK